MTTFRSTFIFALLAIVSSASAQRIARVVGGPRPAGTVGLPYTINDNSGNQWMLFAGGAFQQRGNSPIYQQSAFLTVNNNGLQQNANQARVDDRTGETIFENLNFGTPGLTISRRILFEQRDGYMRYIDVLHNTTQQEMTVSLQLQTTLNYGVAAASYFNEPGGKQRALGWSAGTPVGRAIVEMFAGKGAKNVPTLNWQQNSNVMQVQMQVTVPAGKDAAILHVHGIVATPEAGVQLMQGLKESRVLANVPMELRRSIVNFAAGSGYVGDREILRGDALDVVELRGGAPNANDPDANAVGDQLKGTIKNLKLNLTTFYGKIELPSDKVVCLINVGQSRPRQLIVSSDGEVFGGRLDKESIELELSSGQTTQIPLSQISRIGWRKRATESEEPTTQPTRPILSLRSGDHIAVELPQAPIEVITRYGSLKLAPSSVAAIAFASEDVGVHQIFMNDGSRFAGLVSGDQFQFKLNGGAGGQTVAIPVASLSRLQFSPVVDEPDDLAATMQLSNDDLLVGALVGQLKLDTAFDTLALNAPEIRSMSRSKEATFGADVQIELWDQSHLSGQLQDQELACTLASGITIKVPVMMLEQYTQPLPQPSASMIDRIKALAGELGADDWKQRERAEAQLTSMGTAVINILKQARATAVPEAQQRIDSILHQLDVRKKSRANSNVVEGAPVEGE